MDDGRLTDSQGRTVDFKNVVVIMTSTVRYRSDVAIVWSLNMILSDVRREFRLTKAWSDTFRFMRILIVACVGIECRMSDDLDWPDLEIMVLQRFRTSGELLPKSLCSFTFWRDSELCFDTFWCLLLAYFPKLRVLTVKFCYWMTSIPNGDLISFICTKSKLPPFTGS